MADHTRTHLACVLWLAMAAGCETNIGADSAAADNTSNETPSPPSDEPFPEGEVVLCLDGFEAANLLETANPTDYHLLEGEVVSDTAGGEMTGSLADCWENPSRILEIQGSDPTPSRLGYTVRDREGQDVTPELAISPGEAVRIGFIDPRWGGERSAAVADSNGGLVFAAGELSGSINTSIALTIRAGDPYGERRLGSGAGCDRQERTLRFDLDIQEIEVASGASIDEEVSGNALRFMNLSAWDHVEAESNASAECGYLTSHLAWTLWRLAR